MTLLLGVLVATALSAAQAAYPGDESRVTQAVSESGQYRRMPVSLDAELGAAVIQAISEGDAKSYDGLGLSLLTEGYCDAASFFLGVSELLSTGSVHREVSACGTIWLTDSQPSRESDETVVRVVDLISFGAIEEAISVAEAALRKERGTPSQRLASEWSYAVLENALRSQTIHEPARFASALRIYLTSLIGRFPLPLSIAYRANGFARLSLLFERLDAKPASLHAALRALSGEEYELESLGDPTREQLCQRISLLADELKLAGPRALFEKGGRCESWARVQ